jgi:hypothetical protein
MDNAEIAVIRHLTDAGHRTDARRRQAKAELLAKERNELVMTVGQLQGKVMVLTSKLGSSGRHGGGASVKAKKPAKLAGDKGVGSNAQQIRFRQPRCLVATVRPVPGLKQRRHRAAHGFAVAHQVPARQLALLTQWAERRYRQRT